MLQNITATSGGEEKTSAQSMTRFKNIPPELHAHQAWLLWKYEHVSGKPKPRKVPYYVNKGRRMGTQGSAEDRARLATFDEVIAAFQCGDFDGIGFAALPDWGLVFLDFDVCVKDGKIDPLVLNLVVGTYAEISPSGTGIRAVMRGEVGDNKSHANDWGWGFETFHDKGFVTITGNVLPECELLGTSKIIAPLSDEVRELCKKRFGNKGQRTPPACGKTEGGDFVYSKPPLGLSLTELRDHLSWLDPDMGREEWIKIGMAIHHETLGSDEGETLFVEWSQGLLKSGGSTNKTATKYVEGDPEYVWRSFNDDRASPIVTAATIIWAANQERAKGKIILQRKNPMENAQKLLDSEFSSAEGPHLIRFNGSWFHYIGTHYAEIDEEAVRSITWKWMSNCYRQESIKGGR